MSEKHTPSNNIDINRPYLMPRSKTGKIEVWHVDTADDGSLTYDEDGLIKLKAQKNEVIDGVEMKPTKGAKPEFFSDDIQGKIAESLALDRPGITPEQLERYARVEEEIADVALEEAGVDNPDEDNEPSANETISREKFVEIFLSQINDSANMAEALAKGLSFEHLFGDSAEAARQDKQDRDTRRKDIDSLRDTLNTALRAGLSQEAAAKLVSDIRSATANIFQRKEYMPRAEGLRTAADSIKRSQNELDPLTEAYFAQAEARNDDVLDHMLGLAKKLQLEVSGIIESDASQQAYAVDNGDLAIDNGLTEISYRLMRGQITDQQTIVTMYQQAEFMADAARKTDNAREDLAHTSSSLQKLATQLREVAANISN